MRSTAYKLLGFVVWKSFRWELRHLVLRHLPSRRAAGVVTVAAVGVVVAAVALGSRRSPG